MSVTAAAGFRATGVAAGLKSHAANDLALVHNEGPLHTAAAVFTTNRCKANPVLWSEEVIADGVAAAIVLNSGGANCYTGSEGFLTTHATAEAVAERLHISASDVLVCSTGLIGEQLNRDVLIAGVHTVCDALTVSNSSAAEGGFLAAQAIMTTDTRAKEAVYRSSEGWTIGGMAKGAGMLAPGLATMLAVLTTDAVVDSGALDGALRVATRVTFDRLDSDGCMSTNDTVAVLASGASGVRPNGAAFEEALITVCRELVHQLHIDAEGAAHNITIEVRNALTEDEAVEVGRAVARSNLFKTAIYGNDPNWGRILAAVGTTQAAFDPYRIDVSINGVQVCTGGEPDVPRDRVTLTPREVSVVIDLHAGDHTATLLTNDLTYDYVHENSAYSS